MPKLKYPAFVIVYSPPKYGKTTACLLGFSTALFVGRPGTKADITARAIQTGGFNPEAQIREIGRFEEAVPLIKVAKDGGCPALVINDASWLAESTEAAIKAKRYKNKWDNYNYLKGELEAFRDEARIAGIHVVMNAWERAPHTKKGQFIRGGPKLPFQLPEDMPAICDLVLRGSLEDARIGPHKGTFRCQLKGDYIMGNRGAPDGMAEVLPMNLGEIMRFCGWDVPRHPGLPWQEAAVEEIAQALQARHDDALARAEIGRKAFAALQARDFNERHINWTVQDAVDRYVIRTSQRRGPALFGWA